MANLTKEQLERIEQGLRDRQRVLVDEVKAKRESTANGPNEAEVGVVGDAGDESVSRMLTDLGIEEAGRDLDELHEIDARFGASPTGVTACARHAAAKSTTGGSKRSLRRRAAWRARRSTRRSTTLVWRASTPTL